MTRKTCRKRHVAGARPAPDRRPTMVRLSAGRRDRWHTRRGESSGCVTPPRSEPASEDPSRISQADTLTQRRRARGRRAARRPTSCPPTSGSAASPCCACSAAAAWAWSTPPTTSCSTASSPSRWSAATATTPHLLARVLREAKALAQLSHPNVVQIHDVGESDGQVFIAMEYVDGPTLRAWIEARREAGARWRELMADADRGRSRAGGGARGRAGAPRLQARQRAGRRRRARARGRLRPGGRARRAASRGGRGRRRSSSAERC